MSQTLSASPSSAYTPSRVAANACAGPPRTTACTGGRSTRQLFTTGATGQAGFPRLSSHALRVGSSRYSPRSVPTHMRLPVSGASPRTRLTHSSPGGAHRTGVGNSVQVRPPSVERPHPLPTVPYQIAPFRPNTLACTKSKQIVRPVVSLECLICSQLPAPGRRTKIPCPYVPTQRALSGARASASTCTPKPVVSGSGGSDCCAPRDLVTTSKTGNVERATCNIYPLSV